MVTFIVSFVFSVQWPYTTTICPLSSFSSLVNVACPVCPFVRYDAYSKGHRYGKRSLHLVVCTRAHNCSAAVLTGSAQFSMFSRVRAAQSFRRNATPPPALTICAASHQKSTSGPPTHMTRSKRYCRRPGTAKVNALCRGIEPRSPALEWTL